MRRYGQDCALAISFVEQGETRVLRQKQLIARLQKTGEPLEQAKESLENCETMLQRLRVHLEIMQGLMKLR